MSADRTDSQTEVLGELVHVLRDLRLNQPAVDRPGQFKAPEFNGEGDIELFIQHFEQVAAANGWNILATLLHLREALKGEARECGRPDNVAAVFELLRGRYGLTAREARSRLSSLKRDVRCPLHDHATLVEKLVRRAYEELPADLQANMMLDMFCSSLGNAALQRHLLAIRPNTLTEAVQHGNEYLQVRAERGPTESKVRNVDDSDEEDKIASTSQDPLAALAEAITQLTIKVEQLQGRATTGPTQKKCWGCQKTGHTRKECTTHPWPKSVPAKAGNGNSPQ